MLKTKLILASLFSVLLSSTSLADENRLFIHKKIPLATQKSVKFNFSLKKNADYAFSFSLPESVADIDDVILCQLFDQEHQLLFQQQLEEPKCSFRVSSNVDERYYVKVSNLSSRDINLKMTFFNGGIIN